MKPSHFMKGFLAFVGCIALSFQGHGQGQLSFHNSSSTLILANGTPMPVSGTQQFIFALFLAPSTRVSSTNLVASYSDPAFQTVSAYNTNSAIAVGRIENQLLLDMGLPVGALVDFVVRGWSANAGTTWDEARTSWNNGNPLVPMFIGSSVIGNDFFLGGGVSPVGSVFGSSARQVPGFNMTFVPEPSTLTLAGLGLAAMWLLRRRSH
ncbi:MAG TPA: PEP-CTERM sorting domain-containing protein [Verrucomicrobiae bacterium]|nr:PEP-CTERM sorting domain-containing protein [Verrucomicrobiae bacterium]